MYELADISIFNTIGTTASTNVSAPRYFYTNKDEAISGLGNITSSLSKFYGELLEANRRAPGLDGTKELRKTIRRLVDTADQGMRQYKAKWHSQGLFDDPRFKQAYKAASKARANLVNLYNSIVAPESVSKGFWSNQKSIGEGVNYTQADLDMMKAKTNMVYAVRSLVNASNEFDVWYRNAYEYRKNVLKACKESGRNCLQKPSMDLFKKLDSFKMFDGPIKANGILQWGKHSDWYRKANASVNEIDRSLAKIKRAAVPEHTVKTAKEPASQQVNETTSQDTFAWSNATPGTQRVDTANPRHASRLNPENYPEFYGD